MTFLNVFFDQKVLYELGRCLVSLNGFELVL